MKKYLFIGFFLLTLSAASVTPVHAQTATPAASPAASVAPTQSQNLVDRLNTILNTPLIFSTSTFSGGTDAVKTAVTGTVAPIATSALSSALKWITYQLLVLAAFLLGKIGEIFNWIIVITVFQYGAYFGNSQGMLAAWGILRDIGNIILLFGFIFMGVMLILDIHGFDAKRALPQFIIFAILLNFSLFASEAVVDVSNVLSASFFKQAGTSVLSDPSCNTSDTTSNCFNVGIATTIINDTYLGSSLNPSKTPSNDSTQILTNIATTVLVTIVLVVLLAATIMFFTRAVMLTILLVLSPIGFAAMAIPQFEAQAKSWWNKLLSNAFFAPVFLLLIFVGLKVMEGARGALGGKTANLADAINQSGVGLGGVLMIYGLTVGFMVAALVFAKNSGAAGASFATNFAQKAVRGAVTAPVRATGKIGGVVARKGVGSASRRTLGKYESGMARLQASSNPVKKGIANTSRFLGIDEAVKGKLEQGTAVKFGTSRTYAENQKYHENRKTHLKHLVHEEQHRKDLEKAIAMAKTNPVEVADRDKAISAALGHMSEAEILNTPYLKKAADGIDDIARNMAHGTWDTITKGDKVETEVKDKLKDARFSDNPIARDAAGLAIGPTNAQVSVGKTTGQQLAGLSGGILQRDSVLKAMKAQQLATLDPNNMDSSTLAAVKTHLNNPAHATTPEIMKFKALIGIPVAGGGAPGVARNPNAANRWNGHYP